MRIYVLESRDPKHGHIKWSPIPSYSSLNGEKYVLRISAEMRTFFPTHQFRVRTYLRER